MFVYILFSSKLQKYYTGFTTSEVELRVFKHNLASYGTHRFTAKADDWTLFLKIKVQCKTQGLGIESHIKRMKSKVYIQNLKAYPEIIEKLINKYKCPPDNYREH